MSADPIAVTPSSGNVFADLGFDNPEEMEVRATVAHIISTAIAERGLTQAEAATLFGIKQPDVSKLMRGKLMGFSLERMLAFLNALKLKVEINVEEERAGRAAKTVVKVRRRRHRLAKAA
jgi:predicted XRE-type DNA-binding protein